MMLVGFFLIESMLLYTYWDGFENDSGVHTYRGSFNNQTLFSSLLGCAK